MASLSCIKQKGFALVYVNALCLATNGQKTALNVSMLFLMMKATTHHSTAGESFFHNMTAKERQAVAEVLESYFTPDSPEGLACAMYQLKRIYETQETTRRRTQRRRQTSHRAQGESIKYHHDPRSMGEAGRAERRKDTLGMGRR